MIDTLWNVTDKLATRLAWALVVGLLFAAWWIALLLPEQWVVAGMLAATACASSAMAATLQIRCYMVRTCNLVRTLSETEGRGGVQLHRVP